MTALACAQQVAQPLTAEIARQVDAALCLRSRHSSSWQYCMWRVTLECGTFREMVDGLRAASVCGCRSSMPCWVLTAAERSMALAMCWLLQSWEQYRHCSSQVRWSRLVTTVILVCMGGVQHCVRQQHVEACKHS
jgi:hypothetical protein